IDELWCAADYPQRYEIRSEGASCLRPTCLIAGACTKCAGHVETHRRWRMEDAAEHSLGCSAFFQPTRPRFHRQKISFRRSQILKPLLVKRDEFWVAQSVAPVLTPVR